MLFILVVVFFFFKQETAYEMRISDWSSDVCSSDLMTDVIAERAADAADASVYVLRHPDHYPHHLPSALYRRQESGRLAEFLDHIDVAVSLQIGRASRRESVCQYV